MAKRAGVRGSGMGAGDPPSHEASADKRERIQGGRHRKVQVARTGGRKLFRGPAQSVFLEWFAATCNVSLSAEKAGFNYKTVLRHRMNDERFAEAWDRAVRQGYARLEAKQLETRRRETPIGIEGDWDAPEMEDMDPRIALHLLREHKREVTDPRGPRKQGRRPKVASNAEVREALSKRLKAFHARERARRGKGTGETGGEVPRHSRESGNPASPASQAGERERKLDPRFRGDDEKGGRAGEDLA